MVTHFLVFVVETIVRMRARATTVVAWRRFIILWNFSIVCWRDKVLSIIAQVKSVDYCS